MTYKVHKKLFRVFVAAAAVISIAAAGKNAAAAKLAVKRDEVVLEKGSTYDVSKKLISSTEKTKGLSYKSSKKSVAKISPKGIITARSSGNTVIIINNKAKKKKASIKLKVVSSCTEYTIKKGKSVSADTILSSNLKTSGRKGSSYRWVSRNSKVIKIKKNSTKLKAVRSGTAYIEGVSLNGRLNKVLLKVKVGNPSKSIKIGSTAYVLGVGSSQKLSYKISPSATSNKRVYYEMNQSGIVSITSKGKIKALKPGEVTVTMHTSDGNSRAVFTVSVVAELIRNTVYGKIEGVPVNSSCIAWYGVPYAKPPVGELRWRAPQNLEPWSGILATKAKKDKAAQAKTTTTATGSEDCLYLNVYRPNNNDTNLPVMVYLHGGSNISGSAGKSFKNLASAANCIVVSVEYRLGALGWMNIDALKTGDAEEDSGNFALLDIKKALQWVQCNIHDFGGNSLNVTLSGFSAGARNTLACVISPVMRGLFNKAICFSGGMTTTSVEDAKASAIDKLSRILVNRGNFTVKSEAKKWLNTASKEEVKAFLYSLTTNETACMYTYMGLKLSNVPQLFADGNVIPSEGFNAIASGNYNAVPMLLGSSSQEFSTYALSAAYIDDEVETSLFKTGWKMLDMIQNAKKFGSMYQSYYYIEHNTETFLSNPYQPAIFTYRFNWGNDANVTSDFYADFIGSMHGSDVDFLCGLYKSSYENYAANIFPDSNLTGRKALTASMQSYIGNFLKFGNPNGSGLASWDAWNQNPGRNKTMIFDASAAADSSYMTSMYYNRNDIGALMATMLTAAQRNVITNKVLGGRYFMPVDSTTCVQDEESEELVEDTVETDFE